MTDSNLVISELMLIMDCSREDAERYGTYIEAASGSVCSLLKSDADENDARIVHLCAAKTYYTILLTDDNGSLSSFKAGDVSYTIEKNSLENARVLLENAYADCTDLIASGGFAFKAV